MVTCSPLFFDEGCLDRNNPHVRKIPFFFKKPNLTEMNRIYSQLVTVSVSDLQQDVVVLPVTTENVVKEPAVEKETTAAISAAPAAPVTPVTPVTPAAPVTLEDCVKRDDRVKRR